MKKLMGLVVIVAVLVLGGYFGMGLVTEQTLKRSLDVVNQSAGLSVTVAQYQRHWFDSSAALDVKMHVPERTVTNSAGKEETISAEDYSIDVPVDITHGPIIYDGSKVLFGLGYAKSDITLPKTLVEKFSTYFTNQSSEPKLILSVFVNYLNQSRIQAEIPTFKLVFKDGEGSATWLGLTSDMDMSSDFKNFTGHFTLNGVQVIKDNVDSQLGLMTSDYTLHKTDDGLFLGQAGIAVPSFVISEGGKTLFDVVQYKMHSESMITKGLFESDLKTSFEKMNAHDKQYGPGLLELSIKNLDAKVLAHLNTQANQLKRSSGTARQQTLFAMLPELPKLFAQGAGFEISTLKLTVPDGEVDGHFSIVLPKSGTANPFQILQRLEGSGKLQMPSALVKKLLIASLKQKAMAETSPQNVITSVEKDKAIIEPKVESTSVAAPEDTTQQMMDDADKKRTALIAAKLLVVQGQNDVLEFQLSQGKFTVNGQPFDPATFKL